MAGFFLLGVVEMVFTVYVLQSDEGYHYTGHTADLELRMTRHGGDEARALAEEWCRQGMVKEEHCGVESAEGGVARRAHNLPPKEGGINSGCRFKLRSSTCSWRNDETRPSFGGVLPVRRSCSSSVGGVPATKSKERNPHLKRWGFSV